MIRSLRWWVLAAVVAGFAWALARGVSGHADASDAPSAATAEPAYRHHALVQRKVGFYAVFLPPGYDAAENAGRHYPLVVILHGHGSTEIGHGRLSERFGLDDVLYVAPRAPHPHRDVFLEMGQPGFSAWPNYPVAWGAWSDPSFPSEELETIDIIELYTDWIAETIADARKRYRIDDRKAVLFGHSQGAAFALSFALRHPGALSAFYAHAGHYGFERLDAAAAQVLRDHEIVPFISHYEGDAVVPIAESRTLLAFLRAHEVPHREALLEGGDHSVGSRVLERAREFLRERTEVPTASPAPAG